MQETDEDFRRTVTSQEPSKLGAYPWLVVGLLWFCGFFNYADRQAVFSVFPVLEKEFQLDEVQLGWIGAAFMIVYAMTAPFAGFIVDRYSRRTLIIAGLGFWSLICAATGFCRSFYQLLFVRAAEGLGETFYFPASMSFLSDYHGPRTRSRAMSLHQTSVYLGTAGGAVLAGRMGQLYGWSSPFWVLGVAGMIYAGLLTTLLIEPSRSREVVSRPEILPPPDHESFEITPTKDLSIVAKISRILSNPAAVLLLGVFVGANFVASTFLTWLPMFIYKKFELGLSGSSLTSTSWALASMLGCLGGGMLADFWARRRGGGRIFTQSMGLLLGAPFVFWAGTCNSVGTLIIALSGAGLCKGIYDANIFASLYDVVSVEDRGTAAGLMNTVGWTGGFAAPIAMGYASKFFGQGASIASTAIIYVMVGLLAFAAALVSEAHAASHRARGSALI